MDIRPLTPDYAVTPQITPEDMGAIAAAGFRTILANRPDAENPPDLHLARIEEAAEAAGLAFVSNPFASPAMTLEHVERQRELLDAAEAPVLAYCASGNRSTICWMFANAGRLPVADMISAATAAGYPVGHLAPQLEAMAAANA